MPDHLVERGGFWRFMRRVPDAFRDVDKRQIVSEKTDIKIVSDPNGTRAREVARRINRTLEDRWQALKRGEQPPVKYEDAMAAAKRLNIAAPIDDAAQRTIEELLARVEQLMGMKTIDPASIAAVYDVARRPAMTFREVTQAYIEQHRASWHKRYTIHWERSLAQYAFPVIGDRPVAELNNGAGTDAMLKILQPIWHAKTKTASELRGRIESILDYAKVMGYRDGENPARWRGHLQKLLPKPSKVSTVEHFKAMKYADVPGFMKTLRNCNDPAAAPLMFSILTAARTEQALNARRSEVDFKDRTWTIPAARMKNRKEHRVPLSDAALAILKKTKGDYLFPGSRPNMPFGRNIMRKLMKRLDVKVTVHGFRSSFRDWAAEQTDYQTDIIEMALSHVSGNKVERAYKRSDLIHKRQSLMDDWSQFCSDK